ncbi:ComF family protein [Paucilactobacillus nenjiangensis]|jgi:competence protein ComFC|uniref:ComF family protein n=1 Tax=Paucilactobacillus nenjiangensis TaxID=1296540 RepID=UPI0028D03E5E|nr:ComF family protein [Paucilactobacillus nenjiangensis]
MICNQRINQLFNLNQLLAWKKLPAPLICEQCNQGFEPITGPRCQGCGRTDTNGALCDECIRWENKFGYVLHNQALFHYDEAMKDFMKQYKFNGDYRLRLVFESQLKSAASLIECDLIVPIPVTEATWRSRGFNQVTGMLGNLELSAAISTVEREKAEPQSHKTRQERIQLEQPFAMVNKFKDELPEQNILLIDDVYTTGTTLYHAANLLKSAGAHKICSLTLAR